MPALRFPLAAPALLAALALAGCITPAAPALEPAAEGADPGLLEVAWAPPGAFTMTARDCEEGGFVAAYNRGDEPFYLAEVWETADVREELGNPTRDATGRPVTGPMMGNWHMGFRCATAAGPAGEGEDFVFGYIGQMIVPPAWDDGGADLHFLLSGFGIQDGPLGEALRATTTASITPAVVARVDWLLPKDLPRSAAYVLYQDAEKGDYEGWGTIAYLREVEARTVRLWWQVPVTGERDEHGHHNAMQDILFRGEEDARGEWHPVYWDLDLSAARQYITPPVDGVQLGSHNMLGFEHGLLPGQPTLTNVYHLDEVTLISGRVVANVTLERMWNH